MAGTPEGSLSPMAPAPQAGAAAGATLDGVFRRAFEVFGDRVAVTSEESSLTYAEGGLRVRHPRLLLIPSRAVIVPRRGQSTTGQEIVAFCREKLAGYKRPRFVEFVASE